MRLQTGISIQHRPYPRTQGRKQARFKCWNGREVMISDIRSEFWLCIMLILDSSSVDNRRSLCVIPSSHFYHQQPHARTSCRKTEMKNGRILSPRKNKAKRIMHNKNRKEGDDEKLVKPVITIITMVRNQAEKGNRITICEMEDESQGSYIDFGAARILTNDGWTVGRPKRPRWCGYSLLCIAPPALTRVLGLVV